MEPYPGFEGESFSMPCRNIVPKPYQKPHPPMWMACTNRDTIRVAASLGVGALAFSFVDPEEAEQWSRIYYDTIKSEDCVPIGHAVNANIAMVSAFSIHPDRIEAIRRAQENFDFFGFAMSALVTKDNTPGRTNLWEEYTRTLTPEPDQLKGGIVTPQDAIESWVSAPGIGTPEEFREHVRKMEACGVDQIIFMQQAGRARHEHICESLEIFAAEVLGEFKARAAEREARKAAELAPYVAAAMKRKKVMAPLADDEIPVVRASVKSVNPGTGFVDKVSG
jgi:alkanesulfonate monooxygenase SsuD/methylene tetrahydromethanopterin reductase-like flavin-dependent oxidoreductase (luciferase family)